VIWPRLGFLPGLPEPLLAANQQLIERPEVPGGDGSQRGDRPHSQFELKPLPAGAVESSEKAKRDQRVGAQIFNI
jgi:hypothetical protein